MAVKEIRALKDNQCSCHARVSPAAIPAGASSRVVPPAAITISEAVAAEAAAAEVLAVTIPARIAVNVVGDAISFSTSNTAELPVTSTGVAGNAETPIRRTFCTEAFVAEVTPGVRFTVGACPGARAKPMQLLPCASFVDVTATAVVVAVVPPKRGDVIRIVLLFVLIDIVIVVFRFRLGGVIVDRRMVIVFTFRVVIGRVEVVEVRGNGDSSPEGL
eukprot:scaffold2084_cov155-Skeletonema_menzelii.AAC.16